MDEPGEKRPPSESAPESEPANSANDAEQAPEFEPMDGDGDNTEILVASASAASSSPAWEPLSTKVDRFLQSRFSRKQLARHMEFEDFRMEVNLQLVQSLDRYRPESDGGFWGWLHRIAENRRIDLLRREQADKRGSGREVQAPEDRGLDSHADDQHESPTVFARRRELYEAELRCANQLPARARSVYMLRRRDDLPFEKISLFLDCGPAATARTIYSRARKQVQECLNRRMDDMGRMWRGWEDGDDGVPVV